MVFGTPVGTFERSNDEVFRLYNVPDFPGCSVNEFGAQFGGNGQVSMAQRMNAASQPVAGFQNGYVEAGSGEMLCCGKTGDTGPDDKYGFHTNRSPSISRTMRTYFGRVLAHHAFHTVKFGTGGFN
jgi:hypothetical protein